MRYGIDERPAKAGLTPLRREAASIWDRVDRGLPRALHVARALLVLFSLVLLSSARAASADSGIIWSTGLESGDIGDFTRGGGGGPELTASGKATVSTDVAHSGKYSAKLTINGADGSSGNQAVRLFRWDEPETHPQAYYSAWYFFPQNYTGMSWWNIFQFKSKLSSRIDDPLWIVNVGSRRDRSMYLYLYDWINQRAYEQSIANVPVGQWFQIEVYYQQATDKSGRLTLWQNGKQMFDLTGITTKRPGDDIQWSLNNYTDYINPSDATIYVDDAAISLNRLGPGADAPPPPPARPPEPPHFVLGFRILADALGPVVGQPTDNESHATNGDAIQHTTTGLMVWRKADNWTAFTDGSRTWVNGPNGIQERSNDQRFPWEAP